MAKAIYDVQVPNIGEVERALGDLHDKAPRAMKNAVNQTATRAKNMMVRQARLRQQGDDAEPHGGDFYFQPPKRSGRFSVKPGCSSHGNKLGFVA